MNERVDHFDFEAGPDYIPPGTSIGKDSLDATSHDMTQFRNGLMGFTPDRREQPVQPQLPRFVTLGAQLGVQAFNEVYGQNVQLSIADSAVPLSSDPDGPSFNIRIYPPDEYKAALIAHSRERDWTYSRLPAEALVDVLSIGSNEDFGIIRITDGKREQFMSQKTIDYVFTQDLQPAKRAFKQSVELYTFGQHFAHELISLEVAHQPIARDHIPAVLAKITQNERGKGDVIDQEINELVRRVGGRYRQEMEQLRQEAHQALQNPDAFEAYYKGGELFVTIKDTDGQQRSFISIGGEQSKSVLSVLQLPLHRRFEELIAQAAAGESDWFRHPSTWLARSRELGRSNRELAKYILQNETHHKRLAAEAVRDAAKGKAYLEKLPFPDGFNLFDYPERLIFELFRDGTLGSYIHGIPSVRQEALRKKFKEMATA